MSIALTSKAQLAQQLQCSPSHLREILYDMKIKTGFSTGFRKLLSPAEVERIVRFTADRYGNIV